VYTHFVAESNRNDNFQGLLEGRIESFRSLRRQVNDRVVELQDELEAIDRRLRSAEDLYEAEFGGKFDSGAMERPEPPPRVGGWEPSGPLTGSSWGDALVQTLAESDGPLHVKEIWARMRSAGFTTEAQDPVRSVVAIAVRHPRIVKAAPNTYALNVSSSLNEGLLDRLSGGDEP